MSSLTRVTQTLQSAAAVKLNQMEKVRMVPIVNYARTKTVKMQQPKLKGKKR